MDIERFEKQLKFIVEVDKLKQIYRNTILMDSSRKENDAEHTWHMALCAVLFLEYADDDNIDMLKVLKMALIHDIVEIDAGDTSIYDDKKMISKEDREKAAAERIFGLLPSDQGEELKRLWKEFEESETSEARYAHAIDTFMPIFHNYSTKGLQWQRQNVTSEKVIERNKNNIAGGSKELWKYIDGIINDAVEKGYLKK